MGESTWAHYSMTGKLPRDKRQMFRAIERVLPYLSQKTNISETGFITEGSWQYGAPNILALRVVGGQQTLFAVQRMLEGIFLRARFSHSKYLETATSPSRTRGLNESSRDIIYKFCQN